MQAHKSDWTKNLNFFNRKTTYSKVQINDDWLKDYEREMFKLL